MSYTSESLSASSIPAGIRLGIVRGISYGLFGPPDEFLPQARGLGAGLVRAYVYWGQVERTPGEDDWSVVDALLDQLDGTEEVWVTVCSSSSWATRQPTDFLPPSPAHDLATYASFVRRLVTHCAGRVHYWQCDNEPSNTGLLWAGTAPEYLAQLKAMYAAAKEADPAASVVLGGCGYDVLSAEPGSPAAGVLRPARPGGSRPLRRLRRPPLRRARPDPRSPGDRPVADARTRLRETDRGR